MTGGALHRVLERHSMKRIKEIINALRVLSRTPSATIKMALARVMSDADNRDEAGNARASEEDRMLIDTIVMAVVAIAADMDPAAETEPKA